MRFRASLLKGPWDFVTGVVHKATHTLALYNPTWGAHTLTHYVP